MAGKSTYPSIPIPQNNTDSLYQSALLMRQTIQLLTVNAQQVTDQTLTKAAQIFSKKSDHAASTTLVTNSLSSLSQAVTNQSALIAALQSDVSLLQSQMATLTSRVDALSGGTSSTDLAQLTNRVAALEAKFPQSANTIHVATTPDTTSTTYVMQGINLIISAVKATQGWITCDGQLTNLNNNGQTDAVLCYGTGTPPINGAAQTGTILTQAASFVSALGTGRAKTPFSLSSVILGLSPTIPIWIDLAVKVSAGSQGNVVNVDISGHGIA